LIVSSKEGKMNLKFLPWFAVGIIFLSITLWQVWNRKPESPYPQEALFAKEGKVTDPLVRLMGLTGIRILKDPLKPEAGWPEARLYLQSRDLEEVVPAIQGKRDPSINWLGDPKKERWEEDPTKLGMPSAQAAEIINISLKSLQLGAKSYPQASAKAILFLGAALLRVRMRLAFLNDLYETKKLSPLLPVYILTGERQLDEKIGETAEMLVKADNGIIPFRKDWQPSPTTVADEGEMIKLVFAQSRHSALPKDTIFYVYSPKGTGRRATTESTVQQWLAEFHPAGGRYVAISNQPYVFYQECVIRRVLLQSGRPDIHVEVVGPGMDIEPENKDAIADQARDFLNNISRILYELLLIKKI
jgi:hypothetical protein